MPSNFSCSETSIFTCHSVILLYQLVDRFLIQLATWAEKTLWTTLAGSAVFGHAFGLLVKSLEYYYFEATSTSLYYWKWFSEWSVNLGRRWRKAASAYSSPLIPLWSPRLEHFTQINPSSLNKHTKHIAVRHSNVFYMYFCHCRTLQTSCCSQVEYLFNKKLVLVFLFL